MINLYGKVSSEEGHMISFTISLDPEPDPILFSDPALHKRIISDLGESGSGSTLLVE